VLFEKSRNRQSKFYCEAVSDIGCIGYGASKEANLRLSQKITKVTKDLSKPVRGFVCRYDLGATATTFCSFGLRFPRCRNFKQELREETEISVASRSKSVFVLTPDSAEKNSGVALSVAVRQSPMCVNLRRSPMRAPVAATVHEA
jgi:hypothetical protein